MPLLCPTCKTPTLQPEHLEPELPADRCASCLGNWLTAQRYFGYLALTATDPASISPASPAPRPTPASQLAPSTRIPSLTALADSRALKLCPSCTRFMHYYPVAIDLPCGIDKCNTCGGIWLDAPEWPALRALNLHRHLHAISSDVWQSALADQRRELSHRDLLLHQLGPDDLDELDRVTAWLSHHPHRAQILAHLLQRLPPPSDIPPDSSPAAPRIPHNTLDSHAT